MSFLATATARALLPTTLGSLLLSGASAAPSAQDIGGFLPAAAVAQCNVLWLMLLPMGAGDEVTPDAIYGSGNANGSFTIDRQDGVELGLRGKQRFPAANIFNSNGDGTYTFSTGSGTGAPPNSEWAFEYSVNTDWDGSHPLRKVGDLTYEIGMDNDPGAGTDYLVFDPISIGTIIPYTIPLGPIPYWDHSMGNNTTPNGGGFEAGDGATYATYLATYNVAQNSWRPTFYQNTLPYVWNPNAAGYYDYYLAAFEDGTEVARTAITIVVADGMTLSLEADPSQVDADLGMGGIQIEVELWLRNPDDASVSGYQAFLEFDHLAMTYEGASSSYTATPFNLHFQSTATVFAPGELRLDGNTLGVPPTGDAHLATLVFTVMECDPVTLDFDLTQTFDSETSFAGNPIPTSLLDSPTIVADVTAPVLAPCPANITQPADAGSCTQAVVTWTNPTATDNCGGTPIVVSSPASGSVFPVGTTPVTVTATDEAGNESTCGFNVTVTATNAVDVIVELTGSMPTSRCIQFGTNDCGVISDTTLTFVGAAPAVAVATIEVPCGVWTALCAKDEQHTQWAGSPLTIVGAKYVATATLVLDGGDTDNDGDIDINDVTLLLGQFGGSALSGGCPWNGVTRDADFNNDGVVGSPDYTFLTAGWLTTSGCACTIAIGEGRPITERFLPANDARTKAADLNKDGRVDVDDVVVLEARHGLSGELSRKMRE